MIMLLVIIISKLHIMNIDCIGDFGDEGKACSFLFREWLPESAISKCLLLRTEERKDAEGSLRMPRKGGDNPGSSAESPLPSWLLFTDI